MPTRSIRRLDLPGPTAQWPSDITAAVNEFWSQYQALQVRYEQRSVRGLTLLNSFTWSHSLDNASASLEGNTPSPQDGNNIAADYAQSDYNLPIADVTSLVYDLPFGRGKQFLGQSNGLVNSSRRWMAAQRHQHHAGRYAVQPYLHAEFRQRCCRRRSRLRIAEPTSTGRTASPGFL